MSFESGLAGDCRQQVVKMLALVSSLRLSDYLLDPSTVITHIAAVGLLCALRLQGVERLRIALVFLAEGLIAYGLWRACPSELGTIVVLWLFLNLYEYVLGPRLSLQQNAVLQSCKSLHRRLCYRIALYLSVCLSVCLWLAGSESFLDAVVIMVAIVIIAIIVIMNFIIMNMIKTIITIIIIIIMDTQLVLPPPFSPLLSPPPPPLPPPPHL